LKKIAYLSLKIIGVIALILIIIYSRSIIYIVRENFGNPPIDTIPIPRAIVFDYGLPVDSFFIIKGTISNNDNLSIILSKYNIPSTVINEIAIKSDTVFNLRKIKSGNHYTVFCSKDSLRTAKYFAYEHSPIEYVMFDLTDTINVIKTQKEITITRKTAIIRISTSLWNAMKESNLDPRLAIEMENIYQWSIDFFGLQQGDYFKFIYEEQCVGKKFVGFGEIFAASFHSENKDYYAIPFVQNNVRSYFDEKGMSLKRAFLKAPLKFSHVSSGYSNSRFHPVLKIWRPHHGVDYSAGTGTPVFSIGDGVVVTASWTGGGGKTIKIKHNKIYTSSYMHLSGYASGVHSGGRVRQGQLIGYVGSTGLSTGPHLDFRIYKGGSPVNPVKVIAPPVAPVKKEDLSSFNLVKDSLIKELKLIK
jgi:murein DD-endopeptidase MepM/ murein hydrolase activator NlpD